MSCAVPFFDLKRQQAELGGAVEAAVSRVVDSGWYLLGAELEAFEGEFAEYCGVRHCVGVGSGLSALELSLRAAGIGPGDEVIVPAYTWIATWLGVTGAGATPVPVDVDPETYNLDPALLSGAISERTAAILPVHLRGEPADLEAIDTVARSHGLLVLEDAAQAHGARCRGKRVGALGDLGAFSFYPSKNLGALGDGGAVTTDDEELATRLRLLRNYGMRNRYEIEAAGVNSRLAEIQAAALRAKLPHLDEWNRRRTRLAGRYREQLAGEAALDLPEPPEWAEPVWHLFVVGCADRDAVATRMRERRVETSVHYPLLPHLAPPYRDRGWGKGSFPVAEALADRCLSLPLFPELGDAECDAVAEALLASLSR
jgi:dTDP-4-amino-4,6-dideoxygalactose transaminase